MSAGKPARPAGIGLYGGTFDPIHTAHLRLARALRDELALDSERLIPSGVPPHRPPPLTGSPSAWMHRSISPRRWRTGRQCMSIMRPAT